MGPCIKKGDGPSFESSDLFSPRFIFSALEARLMETGFSLISIKLSYHRAHKIGPNWDSSATKHQLASAS